jgi:hypothetical protein
MFVSSGGKKVKDDMIIERELPLVPIRAKIGDVSFVWDAKQPNRVADKKAHLKSFYLKRSACSVVS